MRICRSFAAVAALTLVAGCAGTMEVSRSAPNSIAVAGSDIVIAGPPGYCIDPQGTSVGQDGGAFVLLGACAAISQSPRDPMPASPGILTVTVSEGETSDRVISETLDELAQYFTTDEGRAALSRAGRAETVAVLDVRKTDGALLILARDTSAASQGMSPDTWRALFGVNDRLLSASVGGFEDRPLSAEDAYETLDALTARIRAASPASADG